MPSLHIRPTALLALSLMVVGAAGCSGGNGASSGSQAGSDTDQEPGLLVVATHPANGAMDIPLNPTVSVTFDREVDCSSLPFGAITLAADSETIPTTLDCAGSTITLTPTSRLAYGKSISVAISTDVVGLDPELIAAAQTWRFTTIVDAEAPSLSVTSHAGGEVRGFVSDNDSVEKLSVSINGGDPAPVAIFAGTFATTVPLTNADTVAILTAVDPSGNLAQETLRFNVAGGVLDDTFGADVKPADGTPDGFISRDISDDDDTIRAGALGASGNLLAVGISQPGIRYDMIVWSFTPDGAIDTTFGPDLNPVDGIPDGYVTLDGAAGKSGANDWANGVDVDHHGNIVVVGHSENASGYDDLVVARFTPTGHLDTTFGGDVQPADGVPDGFVTHSLSGASNDHGLDVVVSRDGHIYAVGSSDNFGTRDMVLWRFTSEGALDKTFASPRGYFIHGEASGLLGTDEGLDVVEDAAGNVLIAGHSSSRPALWRVTPAGVLDTTFGGDVESPNDQPDGFSLFTEHTGQVAELTLDADGGILMAGYVYVDGTNRDDAALWRYLPDGRPDLSFGGDYDFAVGPDGYTRHHAAGGSTHRDRAKAVAIDAAGNILTAGETEGPGGNPDMAIWRYRPSGQLDSTFGGDVNPFDGTPDGFLFNGDASNNNFDQGASLFLDSEGRIVVTGTAFATGGANATVWRVR